MKPLLGIFVAVAVTATPLTAQAITIEDSISEFTRDISKYMRFHRETQVSVDPITGPERIGTATPGSIRAMFQAGFRENRIDVTDVARLRVLCRVQHIFDPAGRPLGVSIQGSVVDAYDDVLTEFTLSADVPTGGNDLQYKATRIVNAPHKREPSRGTAAGTKRLVATRLPTSANAKPAVTPPSEPVEFRAAPRRPARTSVASGTTAGSTSSNELIFKEPPKR